MRMIAADSRVSTSNIYNYFQSKDQIFRAILNPLLEAFINQEKDHNNPENLKLLLFKSHGSSVEGFHDEY